MTERKPYLIGIAGPSGAGKSYLAEHLLRVLQPAVILPLDAYYPDLSHLPFSERERLNFDDPNILDLELLFEHVSALARGKAIEQPVYDFARHTRTPQTLTVAALRYVLVEGLFTLYWPELRNHIQTCVYVDMNDQVCLERRLARDVQQRGRTPEFVQRQFRESVIPMADLYVRPTAEFADVRIYGDSPIEREVAAVLAHVARCAPGQTE
jgi:uridine kinase